MVYPKPVLKKQQKAFDRISSQIKKSLDFNVLEKETKKLYAKDRYFIARSRRDLYKDYANSFEVDSIKRVGAKSSDAISKASTPMNYPNFYKEDDFRSASTHHVNKYYNKPHAFGTENLKTVIENTRVFDPSQHITIDERKKNTPIDRIKTDKSMGNIMIESSKNLLTNIVDDETEHLFDTRIKHINTDVLDSLVHSQGTSPRNLPRSMSAKIFMTKKAGKQRPNSDIKYNNSGTISRLSGSQSQTKFEIGELENAITDNTPKSKDMPDWAKELYENRRDLAPVGTRNLELRYNSTQKQITHEKKRDDYLHNHPDLAGMHISKIDQKRVYIKDNPLINYFTKNLPYVADRQERIKQNDYYYKEAYSSMDNRSDHKTPTKKFNIKTETNLLLRFSDLYIL